MRLRPEILILLAILILGVFFRFYLLSSVPPGLYPDEAAYGNNAQEALETGNFKVFYPENNGREGLFINIQAISVAAFGAEPWALRLVSAVFGTLTILGLYLLTKELLHQKSQITNPKSQIHSDPVGILRDLRGTISNDQNSKHFGIWNLEFGASRGTIIALLSAFFLATSYWHINFSRIGFRAIMVPFFAVFGMYWLLKALRTGKISSTLLAGIATGLGFHTYIAFRFVPFALAIPMGLSLWEWSRGRRAQCVPCILALFIFAALIAALPLGLYFLDNPQDFFGRGGQVSIFSAEAPLKEFIKSNILTLGMFNVWGDCNQRHNLACRPQLFWPVGIFFILGLALTIKRIAQTANLKTLNATSQDARRFAGGERPVSGHGAERSEASEELRRVQKSSLGIFGRFSRAQPELILLVWFIFLMLPATLTWEGLPHALRSIGLIPPVIIIAAIGGAWLWQKLINYFNRALENPNYEQFRHQIRRIQKELAVAALLLLLWIPIATYRNYFVRFAYSEATANAFAEDLWRQGQYLAGLPAETEKFVIVNLTGDGIRGVPAPAQTIMLATDTFDETKRREKQFTYVKDLQNLPPLESGQKVVILPMNPRDAELNRALRLSWPLAKVKIIGDFFVLETSP